MKFQAFIFIILPFLLVSQNHEIDSLKKILVKNTVDTVKLQALSDLNWLHMQQDPQKAKYFAFEELTLATKINNKKWIAQGFNDIGLSYYKLGLNDSALNYYNKSLEIRQNLKDKAGVASSLSKIGTIKFDLGEYNSALEIQLKVLQLFEELKDSNKEAMTLNNIGQIYYKLKNSKKEIEYTEKALAIHLKNGNEYQAAMAYGNLANNYKQMGNSKKSLEYYYLALPILIKYGDRANEATIYAGLAMNLRLDHKDKEAYGYYKKAYDIAVEENDKTGIEIFGHNLSSTLTDLGQYNEALKYSLASLNSADKNNKSQHLMCYQQLAIIYAYLNNGQESERYITKFSNLKDTIFSETSAGKIVEMETKYEVAKKDLDLLAKEKQIDEEKTRRNFTISLLLFFILLFGIAVWAFIQKKKSSKVLTEKNSQLEDANEKIHHQKEELAEKQKEILDSIYYAKKIQNALLASEELLMQNLLNHFVLFKPKDIVSGDFTWATSVVRGSEFKVLSSEQTNNLKQETSNLFYLAVCDSTGHGVPGAFMSLLNIGFLSEAIKERNIIEPGKIFDYVRERLIETIGSDDQKDGFDGILICVDIANKTVKYAASNNSLIIIRKGQLSHLSADKMPVGKGIKTDAFNTFKLNYQTGDALYLMTDGYPDQFGGPKGKKFKYKQLEDLLLQNHQQNPNDQKNILNTTFEDWKGKLEQVDDVCVVGIFF